MIDLLITGRSIILSKTQERRSQVRSGEYRDGGDG